MYKDCTTIEARIIRSVARIVRIVARIVNRIVMTGAPWSPMGPMGPMGPWPGGGVDG